MANVSEDLSQMSMDLLLKALNAFGQLGINSARLAYDIGKDGASTLVGLLNYLESQPGAEYDAKTKKAMAKLKEECEKEGSSALMVSVNKKDLPDIEKWLKKQDLNYVACTPKEKKSPNKTTGKEDAPVIEEKPSTIFFMAKDEKMVENAIAIHAYQKGLINVLPPEAFFILYDQKKDISVFDGLDYFELSVFRELAKKYGLGYTEMANGEEQKGELTGSTYKVVCGKESADKLMSIMRLVSWTMTSEAAEHVKEKVLERESLTVELEKLISEGVRDGTQIFIDESAQQVSVENAKYVVNAMNPKQYIKVTAKGFYCHKGPGDSDFISKSDPDYEEKLEDALSDFPDFVVFDSVEWEKEGLGKSNIRKERVLQKLSVFPPEHSLENDEAEIRKVQKKRLEKGEPIEESAWLFHKYDPENDAPLSEVVENHYNAPSKPFEETVSVHYNSAARRSEKYKYFDVESDERSVDNIILAAKERVAGNREYEPTPEKEEAR